MLLLDGGDVEDTSVRLSAMTFGVAGWRLLGAAGVDAAVVGNGGLLRYGPGQLPAYARALGSAPLVCDLEVDGGTPVGAAPSRLLRAGDLTVGILGITDFYQQYGGFGIAERGRVTAVHREATALRAAGADVVVLLSHAGINHDRGLSWAVRGLVDVIVGGHTHDLLTEGERGQGVPIAQAGWKAQHLGRVRLEVDRDGVRVVDMTLEAVDRGRPRPTRRCSPRSTPARPTLTPGWPSRSPSSPSRCRWTRPTARSDGWWCRLCWPRRPPTSAC